MTRPAPELRGQRALVVGLARTGLAAAEFLAARGAVVTANDRRGEAELGAEKRALEQRGAAVVLGGHPEAIFRAADLVVVSPGVPLALPVFAAARAAGAEVVSEIELASRYLEGTIVAVTGSNGKSTTTALVAAMLRAAGRRAEACGNIGVPFISMAPTDGPDSVYAVEVSSFQLEAVSRFRPNVAVLTHVTPDHMDRYAHYRDYVAAKARIFAAQRSDDHAVLNERDADSRSLRPSIAARVHLFSSAGPVEDGGFLESGELRLARRGAVEPLVAEKEMPLPGRHNVENALAAAVACREAGAPIAAIRTGLLAFRALPHRLERVGEIAGVAFYNDSKATNVDAALTALGAFPGRPVALILGGRDKGGDFAQLASLLRERAACVLTIGEAAPGIERQIEGIVPVIRAGDLERAMREALQRLVGTGGVVLLAPGCASFDQYRNYEARGEHFRSVVDLLAREVHA
jgi:UDP-N-acetylmuramoylalanine--D-glutamate ligase